MSPDIEGELYARFPRLFANRLAQGSPMAFGCECGDGWAGIIRAACELLGEKDVVFTQIKEKWGLLRMSATNGGNEFVFGVLRMAEQTSRHVCERCGRPGEIRGQGWVATLCDGCDAARRAREEL